MFSFLLPTRNRLEYLKLAIETVRRQDSPDWEIVISDNASQEDIGAYVHSLADDRVRYARTPAPLPVTENWNRALAMSSGDHVLMLGDDDGLLPGYITRMASIIDRFDAPDLIYGGSVLFSYPGVDPGYPEGFLHGNTYAEFFGDAHDPFLLTREQALSAVRRSMSFRLAFNLNMQLSLLSRPLIEALEARGGVFQSTFPDYYASCAALLASRRTVADPHASVVIGVTPKSYGFFHLNKRESEGRSFLAGDGEVAPQLAGTNINAGWLSAMEAVEATFRSELGLRVNRRRFRLLTAAYVYGRELRGTGAPGEVAQFEAGLPRGPRLALRAAHRLALVLVRLMPHRLWEAIAGRAFGQFPSIDPEREQGVYRDLLDVFERAPAG